jgi:hypothetical protein
MTTKCKVTKIKKDYRGTVLPPTMYGQAGHGFEDILKADGVDIDSQAEGPDVSAVGLEVKTRNKNASSAFSVGCMSANRVKTTKWEDSVFCEKLQQQLIAFTDDRNYVNNTVTSCKVYDFSIKCVQQVFKEAYETARAKIIQGNTKNYVSGTEFGYLERSNSKKSYQFRYSNAAFEKLDRMIHSVDTFDTFFEEA